MSADEQPTRTGRKPMLPPEQRKRETFTFRVRSELRNRMEEAAAKNGRSLSEEIEFRLEMSFMFENIATKDFLDQMARSIEISNLKDRQIQALKTTGSLAINVHRLAVKIVDRTKLACVDLSNKDTYNQSNSEVKHCIEDIIEYLSEGSRLLSEVDFSTVEDVFAIDIK